MITTHNSQHRALQRRRGSAKTHQCECGETAYDWAYLGGDPDERVCPRTGYAFSLDMDRYTPMCRSCHFKMDRRKAACDHGHKMDQENTYVNPTSGRRQCRSCTRAAGRAYYAKKRLENA